jgi:hypothetical protein
MRFYGEELLAPRSTPKLEGHPLSAVRNFLLNIFAVTLHIGGRSSTRNQRTRHAVVTGPTYHVAELVIQKLISKSRLGSLAVCGLQEIN